MSTTRTPRTWREPPIVFQILVLLFGGLVVAQLVTLILTMVIPPAPPVQHDMRDVVTALQGGGGAGKLARNIQAGPPDITGPGWFTSDDSRNKLASLLQVPRDDVRLSFYAPLPFAGVSGPSTPPPRQTSDAGDAVDALPPSSVRNIAWAVDPHPLRAPAATRALLVLVDQPGGPSGGGFPGGGFPGGGMSAGGFPSGGIQGDGVSRGGFPGGGFQRQGSPGRSGGPGGGLGQNGADAIRGDMNRPAAAPSPGDLASQPVGPHAAERMDAEDGRAVGATPSASIMPGTEGRGPSGLSGGSGMRGGPSGVGVGIPGTELDHTQTLVPATTPAVSDNSKIDVTPPERAAPVTQRAPTTVAPMAPQQAPQISAALPDQTSQPARAQHRNDGAPVPLPIQPQGKALFGLAPAPFVEGDFVAAMQTADGQWVVVQPAAEGFPNAWQRRVLLWFAVAFALVAPIGWLYARHIVKPLMLFTSAAEQLGRDPSAALVALEGPAEIGRAAHAFNVMQSRLRSFVDDRTAMVGAISHDLRTPLTRLRFRIEEVEDDSIREGMSGEVAEMEEMITSVLSFIREASTPNARERLDLGMLVEDVAQDAKMIGSDVEVEALTPAPVEIDVLGMRRLLANLVENAVKYGDRARIRMRVEQDAAIAEIEDDGPGIPEDEIERAFEPFYRASNATNSDKKGTGLGLAVCRSIARAHGGDVLLVRSAEGFAAQLRLPLAYDATRMAA